MRAKKITVGLKAHASAPDSDELNIQYNGINVYTQSVAIDKQLSNASTYIALFLATGLLVLAAVVIIRLQK
ncbi:MAG: hypothetical protein UZ22_OP11002000205 [Microgenomates bacterium OLB23]|nr:MAG: hypothetical protein UZ22_OP11002000205 [Microgenomates bacterium OLB23]